MYKNNSNDNVSVDFEIINNSNNIDSANKNKINFLKIKIENNKLLYKENELLELINSISNSKKQIKKI